MESELRIVRAGGRELGVEDAGPPAGFPVLMMNGAGSRHLSPSAVRAGQDLGFRLLGYDRPGCGRSTSLPGRRIADCAGDIRAIAGALGISRLAVWGSSAGGPYALAAAATLPTLVTAACAFASIGPYGEPDLDWAEGLGGDATRAHARLLFEDPARARAEFQAQSALTLAERGSAAWWLRHWGERAGQDAAHSREVADYLALCTNDTLHDAGDGTVDDEGPWEDHCAIYSPWGFNLADIQAPVTLWHGLRDFLPVTHGCWLADRIPDVTTHFPADEDHTNIEEHNQAAALAWLRTSATLQ
jgi:pimeloyl-ACP methyl ester carboxylesterase